MATAALHRRIRLPFSLGFDYFFFVLFPYSIFFLSFFFMCRWYPASPLRAGWRSISKSTRIIQLEPWTMKQGTNVDREGGGGVPARRKSNVYPIKRQLFRGAERRLWNVMNWIGATCFIAREHPTKPNQKSSFHWLSPGRAAPGSHAILFLSYVFSFLFFCCCCCCCHFPIAAYESSISIITSAEPSTSVKRSREEHHPISTQ